MRVADTSGQVVPTWAEVAKWDYVAWDEARDGNRVAIDMTDTDAGLRQAWDALA